MIYILKLICIWSVVGYFGFAIMPLPKEKQGIKRISKLFLMLFIAGPFCWILFCFASFIEKQQSNKIIS